MAIVVHNSKAKFINSLTKAQLKSIFFDGTISDWSELHPDLSSPINVYVRDVHDSGTAALFASKITGFSDTPYTKNVIDVHITPLVVPTLANDPNGIAYTPLEWVNDSVHVVAIGETSAKTALPSLKTIQEGSYMLTRDMYMITIDNENEAIRSFLDFVLSPRGQVIFEKLGFVAEKN